MRLLNHNGSWLFNSCHTYYTAQLNRCEARLYEKCHEALGYEPLEYGVVSELEEHVAKLTERFGESYKGEYGWASEVLNNKKPGFINIEKAAGYEH